MFEIRWKGWNLPEFHVWKSSQDLFITMYAIKQPAKSENNISPKRKFFPDYGKKELEQLHMFVILFIFTIKMISQSVFSFRVISILIVTSAFRFMRDAKVLVIIFSLKEN